MHLWCSYPSLDIEDAIASFTVRHFSLQFGCFRSSGGISGTTSLYSRKNGKNCSKTTRSSRSNEICWVRCLSLDNDSHNSGSFLSSPLSPAVPKFNDNKPGNLYNSNYLVYHHVILFFNSLVAAYLLFSWSFLYHNLPFGLLGLFYQDLPNCSPASVANSRSTTSNGKFNWYK